MPLHHQKPKDQVCVYCHQMRPASLEDLALYKVLKDSQLVQKVDTILSHIPARLFAMIGRAINANYHGKALKLVELMSGDSEPQHSLFDVKPSRQIILTRFLFYSKIYHKLKPYDTEGSSDVISEILQFVRNGYNYKGVYTLNVTRGVDITCATKIT